MHRIIHITVSSMLLVSLGSAFAEEPEKTLRAPQEESPPTDTRPSLERTEESDRGPTESLPRLIVQDFKNAFTRPENLMIVGVGAGAAWAAYQFDDRVSTGSINTDLSGNVALDKLFESGEIAGDGYVQIGFAVSTYGLGKLFRQGPMADLGRDLVRAQLLTGVLTTSLKTAIGRTRPDSSSQTSFPSGHTSSTFATATVLQRRYGWSVGIPSYAFAGYVAASRLSENKHFLSDVIFGATLGILGGRTVTIDVVSERFAVSPLIVPGGGGVQFTWLGGSPK